MPPVPPVPPVPSAPPESSPPVSGGGPYTDHGTWHPLGSGYTPQPGDVAVYGLDTSAVTAVHVAVVIGTTGNDAAPDVINGDGDRTGYSVVEVGDNQAFADVKGKGAPLSGYVSPTPS